MKLHELAPEVGAKHKEKRLGRGIGTGHGKTSGKGHKGQNARSGGGVRPGFEGGQMPLTRRLPKRGFNNKWAKEYTTVNVSALNSFRSGSIIDAKKLLDAGVIRKLEKDGLKILGNGELTKKFTVKAQKFTQSAVEKIEQAGGKIEVIE